MTFDAERQVAVFIDYENIERSWQGKKGNGADVDWSLVLKAAENLGRMVIRRAYADWSIYGAGQRELLALGVDLIHVVSKWGKNAADIKIAVDVVEMLLAERTHIGHVLLVSGDGDFIELVHRLRARGKVVVGLGVGGTSAAYLVDACDKFILYDQLVPPPPRPAREPAAVDASQARELLRQVFRSREGQWHTGGYVKTAMLRLDPAFSERTYGFESFKEFLAAQSDLVEIRTAQPGGHLEVKMIVEAQAPPARREPEAQAAPVLKASEASLERYLALLAQERIRMTLTEHRPSIIIRFYHIVKTNPGRTLTEYRQDFRTYFEQGAPDVDLECVEEAVHQLFHTYCFAFDQDDSKYPPDVRLWDRRARWADDIRNAVGLLEKCDRGLLQKIGRRLEPGEQLDQEVAARLLYGRPPSPQMLAHVGELTKKLER